MRTLLVLAVACVGVYAQFSEGGKQSILNAHNDIRSRIAKGNYVAKGNRKESATNMLKMKWDSSLEQSAQNYANGCHMQHSTNDKTIGENLYWEWSGDPFSDLDKFGKIATVAWDHEFEQFGWNSNKFSLALFNTGVAHATQIAWAPTGKIGCGVKNCGRDARRGGLFQVAIVCQYRVRGNFFFKNIYNSGATCSACPAGTSCEQSTGLCA